MMWAALISGIINAVFFLDLIVTLGTGEGLAELLTDWTGNSVAEAVLANIPTDPTVFWVMVAFVLGFVLLIEVLLIYIALYKDAEEGSK